MRFYLLFRPSLRDGSFWRSHSRALMLSLICIGTTAIDSTTATAQEATARPRGAAAKSQEASDPDKVAPEGGITFANPKQYEMLIGVRVTPTSQNMLAITASTVFPQEWPEQKVEIVESTVPHPFKTGFRDLPGGNRQLLFQAPYLQVGATAEVTVRVRIEKSFIVGPTDTTRFVAPKRASRELKNFLGNSPYIDASSTEIRKIVREIDAKEPENDWERVEMFYDWVRDNIAYVNGELKTVRQALKDKSGDCEEMTGTFVALCRSADIPARCVWIPNHCYPEFYLEDETGAGHWFPCQVAGTRAFGSMPDHLPVLQKGDRFKVPEDKELLRYLNDKLQSQELYKAGMAKPKVEFVRQLLGDAAQIPAPDAAAGAGADNGAAGANAAAEK